MADNADVDTTTHKIDHSVRKVNVYFIQIINLQYVIAHNGKIQVHGNQVKDQT